MSDREDFLRMGARHIEGIALYVKRLKTLWEECEKDNRQLEDENERLRVEVEAAKTAAVMYRDQAAALHRDNNLLREALRNG